MALEIGQPEPVESFEGAQAPSTLDDNQINQSNTPPQEGYGTLGQQLGAGIEELKGGYVGFLGGLLGEENKDAPEYKYAMAYQQAKANKAAKVKSHADEITGISDIWKKPTTVLQAIPEMVARSAPQMATSMIPGVGIPAVAATTAGNIYGQQEDKSFGAALAGGAGQAALERLGVEKILSPAGRGAITRTLGAGLGEAGTEAGQQVIENLATNQQLAGATEGAGQAALLGGLTGGAMRGAVELPKAKKATLDVINRVSDYRKNNGIEEISPEAEHLTKTAIDGLGALDNAAEEMAKPVTNLENADEEVSQKFNNYIKSSNDYFGVPASLSAISKLQEEYGIDFDAHDLDYQTTDAFGNKTANISEMFGNSSKQRNLTKAGKHAARIGYSSGKKLAQDNAQKIEAVNNGLSSIINEVKAYDTQYNNRLKELDAIPEVHKTPEIRQAINDEKSSIKLSKTKITELSKTLGEIQKTGDIKLIPYVRDLSKDIDYSLVPQKFKTRDGSLAGTSKLVADFSGIYDLKKNLENNAIGSTSKGDNLILQGLTGASTLGKTELVGQLGSMASKRTTKGINEKLKAIRQAQEEAKSKGEGEVKAEKAAPTFEETREAYTPFVPSQQKLEEEIATPAEEFVKEEPPFAEELADITPSQEEILNMYGGMTSEPKVVKETVEEEVAPAEEPKSLEELEEENRIAEEAEKAKQEEAKAEAEKREAEYKSMAQPKKALKDVGIETKPNESEFMVKFKTKTLTPIKRKEINYAVDKFRSAAEAKGINRNDSTVNKIISETLFDTSFKLNKRETKANKELSAYAAKRKAENKEIATKLRNEDYVNRYIARQEAKRALDQLDVNKASEQYRKDALAIINTESVVSSDAKKIIDDFFSNRVKTPTSEEFNMLIRGLKKKGRDIIADDRATSRKIKEINNKLDEDTELSKIEEVLASLPTNKKEMLDTLKELSPEMSEKLAVAMDKNANTTEGKQNVDKYLNFRKVLKEVIKEMERRIALGLPPEAILTRDLFEKLQEAYADPDSPSVGPWGIRLKHIAGIHENVQSSHYIKDLDTYYKRQEKASKQAPGKRNVEVKANLRERGQRAKEGRGRTMRGSATVGALSAAMLMGGVSAAMLPPHEEKEPAAHVVSVKKALGKRESSNNYKAVNQIGYLGKYQFGWAALHDLGYVNKKPKGISQSKWLNNPDNWTGKNGVDNKKDFLNNKDAQESAMDQWVGKLERRIKSNKLDKYVGKTVDGVKITKAGLIQASHLGGVGTVRRVLRSGNMTGWTDANGTGLAEYFRLKD